MNYEEFIQNILNTRGRFACGDDYHERHHILPRCMGGGNEKENLIDLYAKEHFIAHKLLAIEHPENRGLVYAWGCMAFVKGESHMRYEITPEEYEEVRIALSKAKTGTHLSEDAKNKIRAKAKERYKTPEEHPCFGKRASEETRRKQSERAKSRLADPTKNSMYGKYKENNPNYGKRRPEEFRRAASERMKNNNPNKDKPSAENGRAKRVIRLSDKKIYGCGKDAAIDNDIVYSTFKNWCQCHKGFMYYDEYITQQNDLEKIIC